MPIAARLASLKERHEALEKSIHEEQKHLGSSDVVIDKMKKEKLRLKEEIEKLESGGE